MTEQDHNDEDGEDYYLAPQDQRVFGAGIKRKRISFVPASTDPEPSAATTASTGIGAKYLSIVLGASATNSNHETTPTCPICNQPVTTTDSKAHDSSIAHMVCLEHSHPPSHLDRQHKGLKYLQGYGWDPDARVGLGARSEGVRAPVKAKEKRDTAGLGLNTGMEEESGKVKKKKAEKEQGRVAVKLNAKQVRKMEEDKKKKAEKLRHAFYSQDLSQYLGSEG